MPCANGVDSKFIRKQLLRRVLNKSQDEFKKLEKDHENILQTLSLKLLSFDLYILKICIRKNIGKPVKV